MRAILVALAVLLAGCAESGLDDDYDPTTTDSDGDGYTDAEESLAGTDPQNATSVPVRVETVKENWADDGSIVFGSDAGGVVPCGARDEEGFDKVSHPVAIGKDYNATKVVITSIVVTLTITDPQNIDTDLYTFGPGGQDLGVSTAHNPQTGPSETVSIQGPLEAGEYVFVARGCMGNGGYDIKMEAEVQVTLGPGQELPSGGTEAVEM